MNEYHVTGRYPQPTAVTKFDGGHKRHILISPSLGARQGASPPSGSPPRPPLTGGAFTGGATSGKAARSSEGGVSMLYISISGFFACLHLPVRRTCLRNAQAGTTDSYGGDLPRKEISLNRGCVRIQGVGQNDGFGLQARRRKVLKAECTCCT